MQFAPFMGLGPIRWHSVVCVGTCTRRNDHGRFCFPFSRCYQSRLSSLEMLFPRLIKSLIFFDFDLKYFTAACTITQTIVYNLRTIAQNL